MESGVRPPVLRIHADELIVDSFAGGGGASTGLEWAIGRSPDFAVNHDPEAIAMHRENHPATKHFCEDVFAVDPRELFNCQGAPHDYIIDLVVPQTGKALTKTSQVRLCGNMVNPDLSQALATANLSDNPVGIEEVA